MKIHIEFDKDELDMLRNGITHATIQASASYTEFLADGIYTLISLCEMNAATIARHLLIEYAKNEDPIHVANICGEVCLEIGCEPSDDPDSAKDP